MFIRLSGKNITRDMNTVISAFRHFGGTVEHIKHTGFLMLKFSTPAMSYYVIPAIAPDHVFSVNDNIWNKLYALYHHWNRSHISALLVVQFVKLGLPYKAFDWHEIHSRDNVLTQEDGIEWDYMHMITQCPLYSKIYQEGR